MLIIYSHTLPLVEWMKTNSISWMFMDFPMKFSDRLREVPGEVHHDGNGGEEADDAGGVVEGMFLRATGVER